MKTYILSKNYEFWCAKLFFKMTYFIEQNQNLKKEWKKEFHQLERKMYQILDFSEHNILSQSGFENFLHLLQSMKLAFNKLLHKLQSLAIFNSKKRKVSYEQLETTIMNCKQIYELEKGE